MKERPILFSGPMVKAILDGKKTQTRRVIRDTGTYAIDEAFHGAATAARERKFLAGHCPYGVPGDRLWVRETWVPLVGEDQPDGHPNAVYAAHAFTSSSSRSGVDRLGSPREVPRWRPAIFMPRWASRLTLEVTAVRVQRLQEISEEDAKAEGVEPLESIGADQPILDTVRGRTHGTHPHVLAYAVLWDTLNDERAPWVSNPWVWAITFKRVA